MSNPRNDGGPAFPVNELDQRTGGVWDNHLGMTLRDWFAGQFMATLVIAANMPSAAHLGANDLAAKAYAAADAMLAERAQPTQVRP